MILFKAELPVVEDDVDTGDGGGVGALVGLLGRGVGALEDNLAVSAGLVLQGEHAIVHTLEVTINSSNLQAESKLVE